MKLLVLGGTAFLGRHIVEAALSRGHEVTLFNRGRSNPGLFAGVERLTGDRDGGLEPLRGRSALTPEREAELLTRWRAHVG